MVSYIMILGVRGQWKSLLLLESLPVDFVKSSYKTVYGPHELLSCLFCKELPKLCIM